MGVCNVVMTVVSSVLVEAAGRKTLLLIGFIGMFIDTVLLTIALVSAVRIICYYVHKFVVYLECWGQVGSRNFSHQD